MDSITVSEGKRPAPVEEEEQQRHGDREESADKTGDLPQPKRRRVAENARVRSAKACQRCRRLKEKCDGQQPCQRCVRSGRSCEFAPAGLAGLAGPTGVVKLEPSSSRTRHSLAPGASSSAVPAGEAAAAAAAAADSARSEERTKCLERLVQHLLGDVPMDLNNLRRMAEKASQRTGPGSDASSARAGTEDLDDLTLEDENFTVKTLSQSTAREFRLHAASLAPGWAKPCHADPSGQTTRASSPTGTSRRS